MSVTFVLMLALLWLASNGALVLMLRRNARVRDQDPGAAVHSFAHARARPPA